MKQIEVRPQPILSIRRVAQIAMTGVKYRLFRAIVTVAVIVVAMAFLMNVLTESLIRRSVATTARAQIADLHRVEQWIARLSIVQGADEVIRHLADPRTSPAYARELANLMKLPAEDVAARGNTAVRAVAYLDFFEGLTFGRRRLLTGRAEGVEIFDQLADPAAFRLFTQNLAGMKSVRLPGTVDAFRAFLNQWPQFRTFLAHVRQAQSRAIEEVQARLADRALSNALLDADGSFGDVIRAAGFTLETSEAKALGVGVQRVHDMARIEKTVNHAGIRQAIAAERDILPGDVTLNLIWTLLADKEKAGWFLKVMMENKADTGDLTAGRLAALATHRAHEQLLKQAELGTLETAGGFLGLGRRITWLALVSMLVCAVGIANAMLMSVTERFREIATLKCLGALDGFIMTVFLIEAAALGLIGGMGGAVVGFILGATRMLIVFRSLMVTSLPVADLLAAGFISIAAGIVLAAVAAVYPSLRAARLAPMEAMRIE